MVFYRKMFRDIFPNLTALVSTCINSGYYLSILKVNYKDDGWTILYYHANTVNTLCL